MTYAADAGTLMLGDIVVNRIGFGTMRLPGPEIWGEPTDPAEARSVLRRAVELGVNFIDTAAFYGPEVANRLIAEVLYPYPAHLVIATKVGAVRGADKSWKHAMRPELLREAQAIVPIVSVQNLYNLTQRDDEATLQICTAQGIAYDPFFPLAIGRLGQPGGALDAIARRHQATPAQIALAWLLARSPQMLVIPGTSSRRHLEENIAAGAIHLSDAEVAEIAQG
jgi:pyridoxine 4-dehydrogenase